MGVAYSHFMAPRSGHQYKPKKSLVQDVDHALIRMGLVAAKSGQLLDYSTRLKNGGPRKRGSFSSKKELPKEYEVVWPCREPLTAGFVFGDQDNWGYEGLFLEISLRVGATTKVATGVSHYCRYQVGRKPISVCHSSDVDYAGRFAVAVVPKSIASKVMATEILINAGTGAFGPIEREDEFDGIFKACLMFDFSKTEPDFICGGLGRVSDQVVAELERAFGEPVAQASVAG